MGIRKSLFYSAAGRYAELGLNFIGVVIISRLLSPREIGIFAVSMSVVSLLQILRDFGVGTYIVQEKDLTLEKIRTINGFIFLISWTLAACLVLSTGLIVEFYNEVELRQVLYVLALNFLFMPVGAASMALLQRNMQFGSLAIVVITRGVVRIAVTIPLVLLGASYMSMAWASVASILASVIVLLLMRAPYVLIRPSLSEWRIILRFSSISTLATIMTHIGMILPDLVLGRMLGFDAVAYYSRANSVTNIFRTGIASSIFSVLHSLFALNNRTDPARIKPDFLLATKMLTGLSWPFLLFIGLFAKQIIVFMFGAQWEIAAPVMQILCLGNALFYLMANTGPLIIGLGLVKQHLYIESITQPLRLGMLLIAAPFGLEAVAWAQVASFICVGFVLFVVLKRLINLTLRELMMTVGDSLLVTLICCASPIVALYVFDFSGNSIYWQLPAAGVLAGSNWIAAIAITGHPLWGEVKSVILKTSDLILFNRNAEVSVQKNKAEKKY